MKNPQRVMVALGETTSVSPALDWALSYAPSVQAEVELVHVVDLSWRSTPERYAEAALLEAEQTLRGIAAKHSAETGQPIHVTVMLGHATSALVEHAATADLLVMGTPGTESFGEYLVNTRALRVASRVSTSTVVVPHGRATGQGIVVGVDGSEFSANAVAFAAREADRLGERLIAVHSWHAPQPWSDVESAWPAEPEEEERRVLAEAVAGLAGSYPDLTVDTQVAFGRAANVLNDAAEGARMLVVGSHGRQGFAKAWLGSTSEELILAMPTIVAVIR